MRCSGRPSGPHHPQSNHWLRCAPRCAGRSEPAYLYEVLGEAIKAGATTLNITDTVGYCLPHEYLVRADSHVPTGRLLLLLLIEQRCTSWLLPAKRAPGAGRSRRSLPLQRLCIRHFACHLPRQLGTDTHGERGLCCRLPTVSPSLNPISVHKDLMRGIKANTHGIDQVVLSAHCHNDLGQAASNTLMGECVHTY